MASPFTSPVGVDTSATPVTFGGCVPLVTGWSVNPSACEPPGADSITSRTSSTAYVTDTCWPGSTPRARVRMTELPSIFTPPVAARPATWSFTFTSKALVAGTDSSFRLPS